MFFWISVGKPKHARKTKNPKVSGPSERFWIFGFVVPSAVPRVFLVFQQKSKKTHGFFLILGGKPKKHQVLFGFLVRSLVENQKTPCVFLDFCWKTKKHHVFFWISVGKPKNTRKTKKSKSFGPLRRVLDFGIFGIL